MALIRFIEVEEESCIDRIPYFNGQIIFCRDTLNVYVDDPDDLRHNSNIIIQVDSLPVTDIDSNKVYFHKSEQKLYRYDVNEFIEIRNSVEIFDLVADQEDILCGYLNFNNRDFIPIGSTYMVFRGDGSSLEDALDSYDKEIVKLLNPYERAIVPTEDMKSTFIIPLPYKSFLVEGNTFSVYKNGVLMTEGIDYTTNISQATITFKNPVPINTDIKTIFHYIHNNMDVKQEYFITTDKSQVEFTLTKSQYLVGKNMTSLYVNGIKQPRESYTELTPTKFKLNNTVPKGSIILIEIGKLVPRVNTFYSHFSNKTVVKDPDNYTITTTINLNDGHTNKIVEQYDNDWKLIKESAYIDDILVSQQTINYIDEFRTIYTITK